MIEYKPWSNQVLRECIDAQKQGLMPTLDLELTAKCSGAACIYCDSKPLVCSKSHPDEVDFKVLKSTILSAKNKGLKWIYTCGLGEPLQDKRFFQLTELLRECDIGLSMFSNGIFVRDLEYAKRLQEHHVNIILKMDTFDEVKFNHILGKPNVARKIYRARDLLLEAGYGGKTLTDLAFSIVPTRLSIDGIPDVLNFCKKNGIFGSIGELEVAGEVARNNLSDSLGLFTEEVSSLKKLADNYSGEEYMRPICPAILTGLHIDNLGNCVVDRRTGLNCKWFLLQDPDTISIGNIKTESVESLFSKVNAYRKRMFRENRDEIHSSCDVTYVFGGCGGNPKDIIRLVETMI